MYIGPIGYLRPVVVLLQKRLSTGSVLIYVGERDNRINQEGLKIGQNTLSLGARMTDDSNTPFPSVIPISQTILRSGP